MAHRSLQEAEVISWGHLATALRAAWRVAAKQHIARDAYLSRISRDAYLSYAHQLFLRAEFAQKAKEVFKWARPKVNQISAIRVLFSTSPKCSNSRSLRKYRLWLIDDPHEPTRLLFFLSNSLMIGYFEKSNLERVDQFLLGALYTPNVGLYDVHSRYTY